MKFFWLYRIKTQGGSRSFTKVKQSLALSEFGWITAGLYQMLQAGDRFNLSTYINKRPRCVDLADRKTSLD